MEKYSFDIPIEVNLPEIIKCCIEEIKSQNPNFKPYQLTPEIILENKVCKEIISKTCNLNLKCTESLISQIDSEMIFEILPSLYPPKTIDDEIKSLFYIQDDYTISRITFDIEKFIDYLNSNIGKLTARAVLEALKKELKFRILNDRDITFNIQDYENTSANFQRNLLCK